MIEMASCSLNMEPSLFLPVVGVSGGTRVTVVLTRCRPVYRRGKPGSQHSTRSQPRRAASIAATSIFLIVIIASNARLAAAGSGSVIASVRATGVICQDRPHLSLHQPHALSWPPLPTIASQ